MKRSYSINGMTCKGCVNSIANALINVKDVVEVDINLEKETATIFMKKPVSIDVLKLSLPKKYRISEGVTVLEESHSKKKDKDIGAPTKLQQLKPLLFILGYLFVAAFLLHYKNWNAEEAMLDFMGLFFIVFSFFKLLDLKGFPESFRMYDPLAKRMPAYAWIYPFIEVALGLMFLMRIQITAALIISVLILGITTLGVARTLLDKRKIRCACLGTALKLPMTEATLIENSIMLCMAFWMLINLGELF